MGEINKNKFLWKDIQDLQDPSNYPEKNQINKIKNERGATITNINGILSTITAHLENLYSNKQKIYFIYIYI